MKTLALLLALTLVACGDDGQSTRDLDGSIPIVNDDAQIATTTQALALPGPYSLTLSMFPPSGWREATQSVWYRVGTGNTVPVRYTPPQSTTGSLGILQQQMPRGVTCTVGIVNGSHVATCGGQTIFCPSAMRPRVVVGYTQTQFGSYIAGGPANSSLTAPTTNNVNASGAGGYSFRDVNGFVYYGAQCNYTWQSGLGHEISLNHL
jgi:hypothetical protein